MSGCVIVLNAGSSSIKFALYEAAAGLGARILGGQIGGIGGAAYFEAVDGRGAAVVDGVEIGTAGGITQPQALERLLEWLGSRDEARNLVAAGHRVVHGGAKHAAPVLIDESVMAELEALVPIARLHQPYELDAIRSLRARHPSLPQAASFDTAFHRSLPPVAQLFPLPRTIIDSGVRRYGFHGLSYAYIADKLRDLIAAPDSARVVVAHLGSGASMCAMRGGRSIATTMGFTALDGLMMGTRAGSVDPGIILYLMQERGLSAHEVSDMLYRHSGLLGVSGLTSNMRELLASPHPHAREAVELYVYSVVREAGALVACLGGIDALVFTAGIGEHAAAVRARVCEALAWLGIEVDRDANARDDCRISAEASRVSVWVVPTNEEIVIAREALAATARVRGAD